MVRFSPMKNAWGKSHSPTATRRNVIRKYMMIYIYITLLKAQNDMVHKYQVPISNLK
jgi:hypothetical protein